MSNDQILRSRLAQRVADIWLLEKTEYEWMSTPEEEGFDFWPDDFRVRVRAHGSRHNDNLCRLSVRTDCLKDIPIADDRFVSLAAMLSHLATSTYAWVYPPDWYWEKYGNPAKGARMCFSSAVYVSPDEVDLLPDVLARTALLQVANASIQASKIPEMLGGGVADISRPAKIQHSGGHPCIWIVELAIAPDGKEPSRWKGTDEFEAFAKRYALNDDCFGAGDEGGLTVETPFGNQSALIRLLTDEKHPQLGHGLNASMMLPVLGNMKEIAVEAASLNFFEDFTWTRLQHIGSWYSAHETDDVFRLAFNLFIPNSFYRRGLATIITFWLLRRARWLRETKWPDVADLSMMEIYQQRVGWPG